MLRKSSSKKLLEWDLYVARRDAHIERAKQQKVQLRLLPTGFLFKQGQVRKNWKKRWFVIDYPHDAAAAETNTTSTNNTNNTSSSARRRLLYFTGERGELKGEFILDNTIVRIDDDTSRAYSFSLISSKKSLYLQASNEEERQLWACELDRNYRMQQNRKKFAEALKLIDDGQWFQKHTKSNNARLHLTLTASKDAITCRSETSSVPEAVIPLADIRSAREIDGMLEIIFCDERKSTMRRTESGSFKIKVRVGKSTGSSVAARSEVLPVLPGVEEEKDDGDGDGDVDDQEDGVTERRKEDRSRMWLLVCPDGLMAVDEWQYALNDIRSLIADDKDRGRRSMTFDMNDVGNGLRPLMTELADSKGGENGESRQQPVLSSGGEGEGGGGGGGGGSSSSSSGSGSRRKQVKRWDSFAPSHGVMSEHESSSPTTTPTAAGGGNKKHARGKSAKNAQADYIGPCLQHALRKYLTEEEEERMKKVEVEEKEKEKQQQSEKANKKISVTDRVAAVSEDPLTPEDFQAKVKMSSSLDMMKEYDFRSYAPEVFRRMRGLAGITNMEFAESMSSLSGGVVGEGKSGMVFFRSSDGRFIMKTLKESEKNFFYHKGVLEAYYRYMESHPNTLLCSFYGLFKIRFNRKKNDWIVVIVMENAFNTPLTLHTKFDLKGSTKNRYVDAKEQAAGCSVLKDLNFQSKIYLDQPDAHQFVQQAEEDASFLASYNMMDYSLLLGVHAPDLMESDEEEEEDHTSKLQRLTNGRDRWRRHQGGIEGRSQVPNQQNEVYFVSIIDFLQLYDTSKRLENAIKGKFMGKEREVSAVSGAKYAERFTTYVQTIVQEVIGVPSEEEKLKLAREELRKRVEEKKVNEEKRMQNVQEKNERIEQDRLKRVNTMSKIAEAEKQAKFLSKIRVSYFFPSFFGIFKVYHTGIAKAQRLIPFFFLYFSLALALALALSLCLTSRVVCPSSNIQGRENHLKDFLFFVMVLLV